MATVTTPASQTPEPVELHTGDRMRQEEFHRIYEHKGRTR
jgi:hypothetical protein